MYGTVRAPDNRAGAKLADARLAEFISAIESGRDPEPAGVRNGPTVAEVAEAWQEANRPHQDRRSGDWIGWSPKTAKTMADNFRCYLLPVLGRRRAQQVGGVEIDRLYQRLLVERNTCRRLWSCVATGSYGRCSTGLSARSWCPPTQRWRPIPRGSSLGR